MKVAGQQPRLRCGARLIDGEKPRSGRLLERKPQRDAAWNCECCGPDPDIGSPHPPVPRDLAGDEIRRVRSHGEADALRAHDNGRVDADYLACRGHQRAARVARD